MNATAWKAAIGESAWDYITGNSKGSTLGEVYDDAEAAEVLTRASEVGFQAPTGHPMVDPRGTKVLMQVSEDQVAPVLTAAGMAQHWRNRGHGFVILRGQQLMDAVAGPLLPWLQTILQAYEDQCDHANLPPLPSGWRVFVGGREGAAEAHVLCDALFDQSPKPDPKAIQRLHIPGPSAGHSER